ncbi:hypothetical protein ACFLWY_01045 [Chloroflexota bacterium]
MIIASGMMVRSKSPIKYLTQSGISGWTMGGDGAGGGMGEGTGTIAGASASSAGGASVVKAPTALHPLRVSAKRRAGCWKSCSMREKSSSSPAMCVAAGYFENII